MDEFRKNENPRRERVYPVASDLPILPEVEKE
jgi:hypothetical protein